MKVYIVMYSMGWSDGDTLECVFSSEENADKWIGEQQKPDRYSIAIRELNKCG